MLIHIPPHIVVDDDEITFDFIRASGPGGQNVNKVATAVQLRFNIHAARGVPGPVKERLLQAGGRRVTRAGELVIDARRFRTQERNRQDALERLRVLLLQCAHPPKKRIPTRQPRAVKERRLSDKRVQATRKQGRRSPGQDD